MPHDTPDAPAPSGETTGEPDSEPPEAEAASPPVTARADLVKRLIAAAIDGVIVWAVFFVPVIGGLIGAAYYLVRDGLDVEFMDRRSLGKKLLGIRAVRPDGKPVDVVTSVTRNLPLAAGPLVGSIPLLGLVLGPFVFMLVVVLEVVLLVLDEQGRRLGDRLADTVVIDEPEETCPR